ncbi:MAG: hypothetical protein BGO98_00610 [Myxococcales bacterium 68-20]|nr:MAG: hypothetical protein BGO98_00610 [Myxococcales bacterium 68-20]
MSPSFFIPIAPKAIVHLDGVRVQSLPAFSSERLGRTENSPLACLGPTNGAADEAIGKQLTVRRSCAGPCAR